MHITHTEDPNLFFNHGKHGRPPKAEHGSGYGKQTLAQASATNARQSYTDNYYLPAALKHEDERDSETRSF